MFCPNCRSQINDNSPYCPNCGASFQQNQFNTMPAVQDCGNFGFALLGFFVPLVGIILYCLWKNETPLKAKSCLKGAIVKIILATLLILLYVIAFALIFSSNVNLAQEALDKATIVQETGLNYLKLF